MVPHETYSDDVIRINFDGEAVDALRVTFIQKGNYPNVYVKAQLAELEIELNKPETSVSKGRNDVLKAPKTKPTIRVKNKKT